MYKILDLFAGSGWSQFRIRNDETVRSCCYRGE